MSKKCTPLWREAHLQVKMYKTPGSRTTFGRCRKSARRCGAKHISKSKCTKHTMYRPLLEVQMRKGLWTLSKVSKTWGFCSIFNYNTLHSNTLHYTTTTTTPSLHSTTLHSTTLHCTQLHSTTLHYITLHSTTLHYITLHYTQLHYNYNYTTLHYTRLH